MPLKDPIAAYNASSNLEAHLVCTLLNEAGVEAMVVEDVSTAGLWVGGTVSEIHKPQVFIERDDIERARPLLTDYDCQNATRTAAQRNSAAVDFIQMECEHCRSLLQFAGSLSGTVQLCPQCRKYVDVVDPNAPQDWQIADESP
ncbi:hypothetical protein GC163_11255 [bacterium]|nr:hypothetical protein [bacterium]